MSYVAPVGDMQFVIERLCGLDQLAAFPAHTEVNSELVKAILTEASTFASEVLAPLNRLGDQQGARYADSVVTMKG